MTDSLKRFVLLAKGAKGAAAKMVVQQALEAPDVHVFGELIEVPSVKELNNSADHASAYQLLEIFTYGTYADYKSSQGLPNLSENQLLKLRLLTIVALGSENKTVPYKQLLEALDLSSLRQLEDTIIEAIYRKLIGGKLDQKNQLLTLDFVIGRDLRPGDMDKMLATMTNWCSNCERLLKDMEDKMKYADECKAADIKQEEDILKEIENLKSVLKAADKETPTRGGMGEDFDEQGQNMSRAPKRHMSSSLHHSHSEWKSGRS
eukprot:m.29028 g.29028  ORF g.29028 m.29028 type:complete len:262 (+) comp8056_c0_seq1:151-936(+)